MNGREKGNSATRPPDRCLMVLRPVPDPRVVTRDGVALFAIDANCHGPLSQGGLPLRAIWHNEKRPHGFLPLTRIIHEFLSWSTQSLYPQSLVVDLTQTMTQLNSDRNLGTASTYDASDNCRE